MLTKNGKRTLQDFLLARLNQNQNQNQNEAELMLFCNDPAASFNVYSINPYLKLYNHFENFLRKEGVKKIILSAFPSTEYFWFQHGYQHYNVTKKQFPAPNSQQIREFFLECTSPLRENLNGLIPMVKYL